MPFLLDKSIPLVDETTLGRAELKLNHPSISRNHAKIEILYDRPSIVCTHENGITVTRNNKNIGLKKGQKIPLVANTQLSFGSCDEKFTVSYEGTSPPRNTTTRKRRHSNTRASQEPQQKKTTATLLKSSSDDESDVDKATTKVRPSCNIGYNCQDLRKEHRDMYAHPSDNDFKVNRKIKSKPGAPDCVYGKLCFRTNPDPLLDFKHWWLLFSKKTMSRSIFLVIFSTLFDVKQSRYKRKTVFMKYISFVHFQKCVRVGEFWSTETVRKFWREEKELEISYQ